MMVKILQIMPAVGWKVAILDDDGIIDYELFLVGWALCEDTDGSTWVTGCVVTDGEMTWKRISEVVDEEHFIYFSPEEVADKR